MTNPMALTLVSGPSQGERRFSEISFFSSAIAACLCMQPFRSAAPQPTQFAGACARTVTASFSCVVVDGKKQRTLDSLDGQSNRKVNVACQVKLLVL